MAASDEHQDGQENPVEVKKRAVLDRLHREYGFGPVSQDQATRMGMVRARALTLAEDVVEVCPDNRARALALTYLQQAKMWAVQAIVDEGDE